MFIPVLTCCFFTIIIYYYVIIFSQKSKPTYQIKYNQNILPDKNIEIYILKFINKIISHYFPDTSSIQFINIKLSEDTSTNIQNLVVEFYLINKKQNSWNPTENKVQIFAQIQDNKFKLNNIILPNSIDVGSIIPENSDYYFDPFAINQNSDALEENMHQYYKDVDVSWSNIPILRDTNPYKPWVEQYTRTFQDKKNSKFYDH